VASFEEIVRRQRQVRGGGVPKRYAQIPSRVITPQGEVPISGGREQQPKVWSLPKNLNLAERYQWRARMQRLGRNKTVQRRWKRYLELTKGANRWDKESWLWINYGPNSQERLSQYVEGV